MKPPKEKGAAGKAAPKSKGRGSSNNQGKLRGSGSENQARISEVYRVLLELLELDERHSSQLEKRGLTPIEIKKFGYRTFPSKRSDVLDVLARKYGHDLSGVPGFWRDDRGNWKLAGSSGLAIPIRNFVGEVTGLKLRADRPRSPQHKYTALSSNPKPGKDGEVKFPAGTAATVSVHFPLHDFDTAPEVVRITEGEMKADIAWSATALYTISLPGVNLWRHAMGALEEIGGKPRVLLAFDSDKDGRANNYIDGEGKPVEVAKCLAQLYLTLKKADYDVKIEDWPAEAGKGIDDVLVNGNPDMIHIMTEEEADAFVGEALKEEMPLGWVYVNGVKRFFNPELIGLELDKEQFADWFAHTMKGNAAFKAIANPAFPKVNLPIYTPEKPPLYNNGDISFYNHWRPGTVEAVEGDVTPFLEHVEYLIPNEEERNIALDYLAFNTQQPGQKIQWALLIQGKQGTGKSFLGGIMRMILGDHNVSLPNNDAIHEPYTGWQKSCTLIVIEELMARGRMDLMNKLKPMITQDVAVIREMRKDPYPQPNVYNFLMFTNHEDAIILDEDDRRYCVLFSPAEKQEESYYLNLWDWARGNAAATYHWLLARDLSSFNQYAHAPMTEGKKKLIAESLHPTTAWMKECIEAENWPFAGDLVCTTHLADCVPNSLRGVTMTALGRSLRELKALELGQVPVSGQRLRLWAVRRQETWRSAGKEALAAEYLKWGENAMPGGNPLLEAKPM